MVNCGLNDVWSFDMSTLEWTEEVAASQRPPECDIQTFTNSAASKSRSGVLALMAVAAVVGGFVLTSTL